MASLEDFYKVKSGWDPDEGSDSNQPDGEEPKGGGWNVQGILLVLIILLLLLHWFWPEEEVNKREEEYYGGRVPKYENYYDRRTGKLQKYRMNYVPSERLTDGEPALVRSRVFRRGYGVDEGEPYIGYLERPADGVSEPQYKRARQNYGDGWGRGVLVRKPDGDGKGEGKGEGDDPGWVPADSPEGRKIIRDAHGAEEKCQQGRAFYSR